MELRLNNVRVACMDIARFAAELRAATGLGCYDLASQRPGEADRGYRTWGVPFPGFQCLEVFAINDPDRAPRSIVERAQTGPRFAGWGVRTDDIDAIAHSLDLPVRHTGEYVDGYGDTWAMRFLMNTAPGFPYFIEYEQRPEEWRIDLAQHDVGVLGISWIEVGGDAAAITDWLGGAALPEVRFAGGEPGITAVGIATSGADVELRLPAFG